MKIIETENGYNIGRVSGWIKLQNKIITKRNRLYDYSELIEGQHYLWFFRFRNRDYAIDQFMSLSLYSPIIYEEDGEKHYIEGYDAAEDFNPLLLEMDDNGEYVRLYKKI